MNCFVASAFNHADIDAIYDQAIRPVLKGLKIQPLRVDRVEHNDDIDDRIFKLIDKSQLCIADLTHARPSVYYEAGYAFGSGKPVIYIVRSDHFRPREDDPSGNLRVHFDLRMKNMIPWTSPNDAFKKRLRARLRHVTRPFLQKKRADEKEKEQEKAFANLSLVQQTQSLRQKALNLLRARGYSNTWYAREYLSKEDQNHLYLEKWCERTYRQIHLILMDSLSKKTLPETYWFWRPITSIEETEKTKLIDSACVFVSLRAVRPAILQGLFPSWMPAGDKTLEKEFVFDVQRPIPSKSRIMVLDRPRSVEQFALILKERLDEWDNKSATDSKKS